MKMTYNAASGSLSIRFTDIAVQTSDEVKPGVVLDLDDEGRLVGITLPKAKDILTKGADPFEMAEAEAQTDDIAAAAAHGSTA